MLEWNQIPFGWREALDIAVVAFLFYHDIRFVRGTRAMAAINGLFVLLVLYVVAQMVGLLTLVWLLENVFGSLFLVIVVLFHQDIRQFVIQCGSIRVKSLRLCIQLRFIQVAAGFETIVPDVVSFQLTSQTLGDHFTDLFQFGSREKFVKQFFYIL